jgi:hypothetical protein
VPFEAVAQFATPINAETVETSGKPGENVRLLFETLEKPILKQNLDREKVAAKLNSEWNGSKWSYIKRMRLYPK